MSSDKITWPKPGQKMEGEPTPLFTISIIDKAFDETVQRFFVPTELLDNHKKEKKE